VFEKPSVLTEFVVLYVPEGAQYSQWTTSTIPNGRNCTPHSKSKPPSRSVIQHVSNSGNILTSVNPPPAGDLGGEIQIRAQESVWWQSEKGRGQCAYDARRIKSQKPLGGITDFSKSPRNT
jgi:hypothetical protein